tara:strand:+ start:65 stop:334 length:270 start_codon:yes stop_codon:yes gene_type:complete
MGSVEQQFNVGLVKATVWKNKSKAGDEFKTVSLSKSYMKDDEWQNTSVSLGEDDVFKALEVLQQVKNYFENESLGDFTNTEAAAEKEAA